MGILFVTGIHAVGKSTLCQTLSEYFSAPYYSASDIIKTERKSIETPRRYNSEIDKNASLFKVGIENLLPKHKNLIVDGHTVLLNEKQKPHLVEMSIFENLSIECVLLLVGNLELLVERWNQSSVSSISKNEIDIFQRLEILQTIKLVTYTCCDIVVADCLEKPNLICKRIKKLWFP